MILNESVRKNSVVAFLAAYLFAAFSVFVEHGHNGGAYLKDFHFKTEKNTLAKAGDSADNAGCAICHFQDTPLLFSFTEIFQAKFYQLIFYRGDIFFGDDLFISQPKLSFFLRGPPEVF